jgi:hypothetical protein
MAKALPCLDATALLPVRPSQCSASPSRAGELDRTNDWLRSVPRPLVAPSISCTTIRRSAELSQSDALEGSQWISPFSNGQSCLGAKGCKVVN